MYIYICIYTVYIYIYIHNVYYLRNPPPIAEVQAADDIEIRQKTELKHHMTLCKTLGALFRYCSIAQECRTHKQFQCITKTNTQMWRILSFLAARIIHYCLGNTDIFQRP